MDRRKDTPFTGTVLPRDYLKLVEDVFNKNFSKHLLKDKAGKEAFVVQGEVFTDELILVIALKNSSNLRMTTCYASIDYPPPRAKLEEGEEKDKKLSASENVQKAVNACVDAIASFFNTYFEDGRPVDYDIEYRQNWTIIDIDKLTRVYVKINRDNLELGAQANAILERAESDKKKKKLH